MNHTVVTVQTHHIRLWSGEIVYNCVYRSGLAVVNAVLGVFGRLSSWWKADMASVESKMMSLTLLMKLIVVDASVLSDAHHPAFAVIWSMYTGLLTDRNTTLAFKVPRYFATGFISHLLLNSSVECNEVEILYNAMLNTKYYIYIPNANPKIKSYLSLIHI